MAWIRIRSLIYTLPLLASGTADVANSVQDPDQAAAQDVMASNQIYSAGPRERRFIRTSDGSTIWLNFGASILVAFTTETRSVIMLSGEALFTVKHDSGHPFRVLCGRSVAEDVGTVFSVAKKLTSSAFLVAEGEIAIFDSAHLGFDSGTRPVPDSTELSKFHHGERVEISDESGMQLGSSHLSDDDILRALAWKDGRVRFAKTPLAEAVAEINRYSETRIVLAPDVQQRKLWASGSYTSDDADGFAASLKHEWQLESHETTGPDGNPIIILTSAPDRKHPRHT
jgi:transmembrane sensor